MDVRKCRFQGLIIQGVSGTVILLTIAQRTLERRRLLDSFSCALVTTPWKEESARLVHCVEGVPRQENKLMNRGFGAGGRVLDYWTVTSRPCLDGREKEDVTVTPLDSPLVPLFGGEKEDQSRDNNYFSSFPFLRRVVSWRSWLKGLDITYISWTSRPLERCIRQCQREDRRRENKNRNPSVFKSSLFMSLSRSALLVTNWRIKEKRRRRRRPIRQSFIWLRDNRVNKPWTEKNKKTILCPGL